jgi:Trk K+ transport system NAD-binding subunit
MMAVCSFLLLYAHGMQSQVLFLQEELQRLQENAELCPEVDLQLRTERTDIGGNNLFDLATKLTERHIRSFALLLSLLLLASPILCIKYIDDIYRISRSSRSSRSCVQNQDSENIDEEVPFSKRLAYRLDVLFSNHSFIKPLALFMATVLLIAVGGMALFGVSGENLADALWRAWTYIADSGNHADSTGIGPRLVSVFISFGGMLIFALMLGLVSDAISEKVDSLRKGKSEVIEHDHTLILGWSDKLGSLLKQLSIANQSVGGGVVVVLSERDKEEMEMDIAKLEFDFKGTSVICRSGSPLILADLKKVSVSKARSIIVLAEVENADQSDARALRVVLSLTGVKEGLRGHVVVEISDLDNEPLVKLVGGGIVETVVAHDVIGRLMIQCARQPGLAQIWEDILGFENAEFYLKRWPQLDGKSFGELLISFPDAIPCGVKVAAKDGKIVLNPSDDYIMCEGDELLVVAEDDDSYAPTQPAEVQRGVLPEYRHYPKIPEKILFCGWRRDIDDMIVVLDAFLAPGSELWMFSEVPITEREKKLLDGDLQFYKLKHLTLVHKEGNAVIRRHLEMLPLETFDSILILADEALEDSVVKADSRSLATLLLIRDIQSKRMPDREERAIQVRQTGSTQSTWIREMQQASYQSIIISEILDSRTKNLVSVSKIGDYVLSNELVSMALAMVAEDKQINRVLEELFAEEVKALSQLLHLLT